MSAMRGGQSRVAVYVVDVRVHTYIISISISVSVVQNVKNKLGDY